MSKFHAAITRAQATIRKAAGATAIYRRGESFGEVDGVVPARSGGDVDAAGNTKVEGQYMDWLIEAAALLLDEVAIEPERGDLIEIDGRQYEVAGVGGEKPWRWTAADHTTYRARTRYTGTIEE